MGNSHVGGAVDPQVAKVGANRADISGMASGPSSDEINDRLGRPREGQVQPAAPRPHFVSLNLAGMAAAMGTPLSELHPQFVPSADFAPIVADQSKVVYGWLADVKGDWHAVDAVRKLTVSGGRVEALFADGSASTLANYGADLLAAVEFRARVASYVMEAKGIGTE